MRIITLKEGQPVQLTPYRDGIAIVFETRELVVLDIMLQAALQMVEKVGPENIDGELSKEEAQAILDRVRSINRGLLH